MEPYITKMKAYLGRQMPEYDGRCIENILEELYLCYTGFSGLSSEKIESCSRELEAYIGDMPFERRDRISSIMNDLCAEQDRIAFLAGVRIGICMMLELTAK